MSDFSKTDQPWAPFAADWACLLGLLPLVLPSLNIPVNVTDDSGNVTGIPVNVTDGWCCAI